MPVIKLLLLPLSPFIGHPERAWIVAGLLAILLILLTRLQTFRASYHLPIALAALAWGGFGFLEQLAVAQGWNIRVDLLLVGPLLIALSIWAAWAGFRAAGFRPDRNDADVPSNGRGTEGGRSNEPDH